jgi:glycosyltransferase involved in cell wall biosynthesis
MKIVFIDPTYGDYTTDTASKAGLGGSQSALCYLAVELVRLGHRVTIANGISHPGPRSGIDFLHVQQACTAQFLNQADVVVVLNAAIGLVLRGQVGVTVPLVLWTGHADDVQAVQALKSIKERKAWSAFAFVSRWQANRYFDAFRIPTRKSAVLLNCIAPSFIAQAISEPWYVVRRPPTLAFTSTPFRGLDVLLDAFQEVRLGIPNVRLRVYSSMKVYLPRREDPYAALYRRCETMEGVEYVGSVGQTRLAAEMAQVDALAYPSTFAETFCIAAMEAMSVGALLISTRLGALPELNGDYGVFTDFDADKARLTRSYAQAVIRTLLDAASDPVASNLRRNAQIGFYRERFSWPQRAQEWSAWLPTVAR